MRKGFLIGAIVLLFSCGIEDYIYLDPIPSSNVIRSSPTRVTVAIPSPPTAYFTNYVIFYRIYISGTDVSSEITDNPGSVNTIGNTTLT
ncbi:MAG: hypothetical protein LBH73_08725, partial [Spirochaetaceae bacterium]|nr:hypothetical protein [Spirochaetaceae bacterium]